MHYDQVVIEWYHSKPYKIHRIFYYMYIFPLLYMFKKGIY